MNTHVSKRQENKSIPQANPVFQNKNIDAPTVAQRKLQEMANNSPQAKKAAQLRTMAANYATLRNNNSKVKQLVKEINHISNDISGVCGYMALHAAFTALNPAYFGGKDWSEFKKTNPTILANDATSICTIHELLVSIEYYNFVGVVHEFKNGPELVAALEKTGENPVLIGHTLLNVPQRSTHEVKTAGDLAHWSVISKVKDNLITMWDNWCDGGPGERDKPYEIDAEDLAKKSLVLEGQTHEYPLVSDSKKKERRDLDIHGRLVEVRLK